MTLKKFRDWGAFVALVSTLFILSGPVSGQTTPPPQAATQAELAIDQIKKTVVFLQTSWSDSTPSNVPHQNPQPQINSTVGTGFLISIIVPELGKDASGNDRGFNYLVTAKHVIRRKTSDNQPGPYANKVTVRFNTMNPIDASGRHWESSDIEILDERGDLT